MGIELLHMDCMEYMRTQPDKSFDLAIVDPPYGLSIAAEKPRKSGRWDYGDGGGKDWDNKKPDAEYFKELVRVSKNQIVWGGNYFTSSLPESRCWISWDKQNPVPNFADIELAWTSFDQVARCFRYSFAANKDKIHPTQKPVALYKWLLHNYAKPGQRILDTHLGSGSSAIAAHYFGVDFVGCELDKDYFEAAKARFDMATKQLAMSI